MLHNPKTVFFVSESFLVNKGRKNYNMKKISQFVNGHISFPGVIRSIGINCFSLISSGKYSLSVPIALKAVFYFSL